MTYPEALLTAFAFLYAVRTALDVWRAASAYRANREQPERRPWKL